MRNQIEDLDKELKSLKSGIIKLEEENKMLKERILKAHKYIGDVHESDYTGHKRKNAKDELSKAIYMFNRNEAKRNDQGT